MADMQIVPAARSNVDVEVQYVELMVPLYSHGCEKKVKKGLAHLRGIYSINVDFHQQKVIVWGICNKYDVLANIRNKRKGARFWYCEDNVELNKFQEATSSSSSSSPSSSIYPKRSFAPPLALIRARSLSWKALKKVFERSYSF